MAKQFISLENLEHFWGKVKQIIIDNEQTASAALNELNERVDSLEENESLNDHINNDDIHVTAEDKAKWNAATENNGDGHTHPNKEVLDGITANKVSSWDNKQDAIADLSTIRSNAEKGASALQSIPAEYVTESEMGTAINTAITELVGNAPDTLNSIEELADALRDNKDIVSVLESSIANKADKTSIPTKVSDLTNDSNFISSIPAEYVTESELTAKGYLTSHQDISGKANVSDLTAHTNNSNIHVTTTDKSKWNAAEQNAKSYAKSYADGLASNYDAAGAAATALTNAKSYADDLNADMDARVATNTTNIGVTERPLADRITNLENSIIPDARASVLWLGTSIPAGDISIDPQQLNTYPKMVADALGFNLYNKAKAGSFVAWYPQAPNWTTSAQVAAEFATAYCLSATRQEIYDKYYNVLDTIRRNERLSTKWRDDYLNDFMDSSYETRIMPYIDGTIAKCDGVVIDHGFNDRGNIFNVCNQHVTADKDSISVWGPGSGAEGIEYPVVGGNAGWWWLTHLADNRYYDGEVYMNTVYAVANGLAGNDTGGMRGEYFGAMAYIIAKIQQVDPRIRIVIGNYFSQDYGSALGDGMNSFQTKYILQANQSIADYYGFPCVNVYKHTGLRNRTIRKPDGTTIPDMYWFCPDGVHPSSDTTGLSNSIIASAYVAQIKGAFFSLV